MDAVEEIGRNPVSKHQIQPECGDEQDNAGWDGVTCLNSQTRTGGQENIISPYSADHERDCQPYLVDPVRNCGIR